MALQLAKNDGDKAAKELEKWAVDVGKDLNSTLGGVLEHMFDHFDTSKPTAHLKSLQDEFAKTARAAADASRIQVSSAGNVEVAIRRLQEAHNKYADSSSQVAAAENRLVNARALSTQAANDAAAAANTASAAHNALGAASEGAGAAAEGMGAGMLLGAAGVAAVGAAAVLSTKKLYDMGEQWRDISDKITFETGRIGASAAAMTDQIAHIADKTAAPIGAIGDVYTQLTRLKVLQGDTLNDLTKQVADYDQMASKVGADPLNIGLFTRMMQEFHTPADQVSTDLNTIVGAAQAGQVPINELLETMQTFGPTADLLGLSYAQTTNLLSVLDETGADVNKTLQSLKIGMTQIAKDTPALQKQIKFTPDENDLQRMKDVIAQIGQLYAQNTAAASDAADKLSATVFGRQWQTVADDIKNGKFNLDDLNTSADATPDKIEQMRTATQRFGQDWQLVKNQITDALKPLSEHVFDALDTGMMNLDAFFTQLSQGDYSDALGFKGFEKAVDDLTQGNFKDFFHDFQADNYNMHPLGDVDTGSGHGADSQHAHRGDLGPGGKPGLGAPTGPTGPDIDTAKPYRPLDLNPADKPPGAESYDEWVESQKRLQSALDRETDTSESLTEAKKKQQDLIDSGKATQEELNSSALDLSRAQREEQEATDDVTIAKKKYTEDAAKAKHDRDSEDNYDPFKEATKHSKGLIPELAGLFSAAAINQALGNPYGKLQAAKRGEDPSNPLYVSDVRTDGLPGALGNLFRRDAIGQAPPGGAGQLGPTNAPAGSIPAMLQPGTGPPGTHQWWGVPVPDKPTAGAPSQPGYTTDAALLARVPAGQYGRDKGDDLTKGLGDCSSAVEDLVNLIDGKSTASGPKMYTGNEAQWLSARGFMPGVGAPGDFRVGFNDHHTQATLPGGTNFNWGSDAAAAARGVGPNAGAGAFDPAFTSHYYRPEMPLGTPPPQGYASGGNIASSDTVPAMLTPGEEVVKKDAAEKYRPELEAMNAGQDPHKPKADAPRVSPSSGGPGPSSRQPLGSVTPPPAGPRVGQGTGSGFGIGGGLIGFAENAAITAAMAAAAMSTGGEVLGFDIGGGVPGAPTAATAGGSPGGAPGGAGGGGSTGGGGGNPSGASGDPLTAVLNRTVGYIGQLGAIGVQGAMSSLIPGASQKGGIMDGGIISKVAGGFAGAHPSAPNTAGSTPVPLAPPAQSNQGQMGGDTHIGTQGVSIGTLINQNGQSGTDLANDLAFKSYAGYGSR